MENPLVLCFLTALCFVGWPLLARFSGATSAWIAVVMTLGTLAIVTGKLAREPARLSLRDGIILLVAGVCNGLGIMFFSRIVANPHWEASRYNTIVFGLMLVLTMVLSIIFLCETITLSKVIGLLFMVVGVYCLAQKSRKEP